MRIFNYDPRNGLFIGASNADRNPEYDRVQAEAAALRALLETGLVDEDRVKAMEAEPEFHMPAHCTLVEPPAAPEGYGAYWRGASWEVALLPVEEGEPAPPEPTEEEKAHKRAVEAEALVEEYMQAMARGMGYKSLELAITYADEPAVPKYQAEGQALRSWRSRVWEWFYSEDVQLDVAQADFDENSLTEMPPLYPDVVHNPGDPASS